MKHVFVVALAIFFCAGALQAQQPDTLIRKLDSLSRKADSLGGQTNNTNPASYTEATGLTVRSYLLLMGSDLKQAFTKPFHMTGTDWGKVGKFALVAGALALADESVQRFAVDLREHNHGMQSISRAITNFGGLYEGYTLAAFGLYGYLSHSKKMQTTTLLATQSYITGAAVSSVLKFLTGRQRPFFTDSTRVQAEPTFYGPLYKAPKDRTGRSTNSSFPSGHTTVAFAAATVFALEYKNKPFIPILAYSAATLIGLSRITENRHWATDVLAGAALGYLSGRLVVYNYHRYALLKAPKKQKNNVRFGLQYQFGQLTPGLVYTFK